MSLVFYFLLMTFAFSESNLEEEDVLNAKFTHFTNCYRDDKQDSLKNKFGLFESRIQDLNYKLNTLNLIVDQLFEELKATLDEIPKNNLSKTATIAAATSTQQVDAVVIPSNCEGLPNGTHLIQIPYSKLKPFHVYCTEDPQLGAAASWIVIQRRCNGSVDFNRNFSDYQQGFGNLEDDFFIGLEKLNALTHYTLHELWIQIEDHANRTLWARYSSFAIGNESESYALYVIGNYTGNAGDGLDYQTGQRFTTKDVDNDEQDSGNCAVTSEGGWWYRDCYGSNLNGRYHRLDNTLMSLPYSQSHIAWTESVHNIKYVHMAIRPLKTF